MVTGWRAPFFRPLGLPETPGASSRENHALAAFRLADRSSSSDAWPGAKTNETTELWLIKATNPRLQAVSLATDMETCARYGSIAFVIARLLGEVRRIDREKRAVSVQIQGNPEAADMIPVVRRGADWKAH
jgi:hypothetical protein